MLNKNNSIPKSWIFVTDPISEILPSASYESNATINAISKRLGLDSEERFEEANKKIEEIKKNAMDFPKLKNKRMTNAKN